MKNTKKRFFKFVKKTKQCWLWTGACSCGYGAFRFNGKNIKAHRFSWFIHNGMIPNAICVLHKCDVRSCVNPKHLFLGTYKDNTNDMVKKGRDRKALGSKNGKSKLTEMDIKRIRNDTRSRKEIAAQYSIALTYVSKIRKDKKLWRHI